MLQKKLKEELVNFDPAKITFLCLIGKGSFGEVHKCRHDLTGLTLAIKTIDLEKADDDIDDIRKEISFHGQCDHPNITSYFNSRIVGSKLWILMEYLGGGSTLDLLKLGQMEEVYIATILRETLKGIAYLHDENKIHRDIKCANILLSDIGEVKLADFGVAGQLSGTLQGCNTFVGTPFWMAPEVIKQANYDSKADIWSLGITLYELTYGHPPYHDLHPMKALFKICNQKSPEIDSNFSRSIRDLCSICLRKEPEMRPTARTLLKHKFIRTAKKTSILTDLLEKLRASRSLSISIDDSDLENNETRKNDVAPDWVFETVRVSKDSASSEHSLPSRKISDDKPANLAVQKNSELKTASSFTIIKDTKSLLPHPVLSDTQEPINKIRQMPSIKQNRSASNSDDEARLNTPVISKWGGNRSSSKRDASNAESHKILNTVTLFNNVVTNVVSEYHQDANIVSEFVANFSDKTKQLADFYTTITKLANDTKIFNSFVKK